MTDERPPWAKRLRAEREGRKWTQVKMASKLHEAAKTNYPPLKSLERQVRGWEAGDHYPETEWRRTYCIAFGLSEAELFGGDISRDSGVGGEEDEDDVERRRVLQALATLGVAAASPVADALNTIQGYVEKGLDRGIAEQMEEWDQIVTEYGYSYLASPPDQLISDLAADLVSVQALKSHLPVDNAQRAQWFRVNAGLSLLMAKTLANLGDTRPARTWWRTAQHAADSSGDTDLRMWIAGEQLIRGLYERRPAPILLRQADAAAGSSNGRACAGLALIQTMRAQLLSVVRPGDAVDELQRLEDTFAKLPSADTSDIASDFCFGEDRIRYATAWVYAQMGQSGPLDVAADRAVQLLEAVDQRRSVTQIKLLQAAGHVRSGDVAEGVAHATSTYEQCPPDQRTVLVTRLAGGVWDAIPVERRKESAAESYHELLALSGPPRPKAIT